MLQLNLAVKIRYYDGCNELQQDLWISKFSRNTTLQRFVILELLLFPARVAHVTASCINISALQQSDYAQDY